MNTGDVSFVDLDGDKDLDIVAANVFSGHLQAALNNGKGFFTEVTEEVFREPVRGDAISVDVLDINGDGRMDIYVGMFRGTDKFFINKRK
jgi:hypothetical protein